MAIAHLRGVDIHYTVVGSSGPWLALITGGRSSFVEFVPLAARLATQGFRVVLHDRRNTGASQVLIEGDESEETLWADDVVALMDHLGAPQAFYGGASAGARTSMIVFLRHRAAVQGLMLMRITGGEFAAGRLPTLYYKQFIRSAQRGGMAAVCATDHYAACIDARPANHDYLMSLDPAQFVRVMSNWLELFTSGPTEPVFGVTAAQLIALEVPVLVVPGNDRTHPSAIGLAAADLMPGAEVFRLPIEEQATAMIPFAQWAPYESAISGAFAGFMRRHGGPWQPAPVSGFDALISEPMPLFRDSTDSVWSAAYGVYPTRIHESIRPRPM